MGPPLQIAPAAQVQFKVVNYGNKPAAFQTSDVQNQQYNQMSFGMDGPSNAVGDVEQNRSIDMNELHALLG